MDKLMKRLSAVEIRISALRLEIVGIKDELNRLAEKNVDQNGEVFLELKLNLLAKKFELAKMRSERKLLELQVHTGHQAA